MRDREIEGDHVGQQDIDIQVDITGIVESARQAWTIPGISVAVVRSGSACAPVHAGYVDLAGRIPVSDTSLFQIGSISKSFTGALFAQLADTQQVDLDEPVTTYLPWFRVESPWSPITLRHLLHHTAGLVTCLDAIPDAVAQAAAARDTVVGCAPGEWFHYSNVGYAILGLVAESVTGTSIGDCVQRALLDPMGMDQSYSELTHDMFPALAPGQVPLHDGRPFLPGDQLIPAPWFEFGDGSGNIAATAHDMGRYARMLLGRGVLDGRRILSESAFERFVTDLGVADPSGRPGLYGLGLEVIADADGPVLAHSGGMVGFSAHLVADLGHDVGVVVLTNAPGESGVGELVAMKVLDALKAGSATGHHVPDRRIVDDPERYVGSFTDGSRSIRVTSYDEGRLRIATSGVEGDLYETRHGWLASDHPDLRDSQHRVEVLDGVRCWTYGAHTLPEAGVERPVPESGGASHPLVGEFRSYNPWYPSFRIVRRGEDLILVSSVGVESPMDQALLVPVEEGTYRIGADHRSPERLVCGPVVEGEIAWVDRDLCRYTRSFRG